MEYYMLNLKLYFRDWYRIEQFWFEMALKYRPEAGVGGLAAGFCSLRYLWGFQLMLAFPRRSSEEAQDVWVLDLRFSNVYK